MGVYDLRGCGGGRDYRAGIIDEVRGEDEGAGEVSGEGLRLSQQCCDKNKVGGCVHGSQ